MCEVPLKESIMLVAATARIFSVQVAFGMRWPSADSPEEIHGSAKPQHLPSRQDTIDVQATRVDDRERIKRSSIGRHSLGDMAGGSHAGSERSYRGQSQLVPTIVYGPSSACISRFFECGRNLDCLA